MNLFPFQTATAPMSVPVESVELKGAAQGAALGKAIPSTITAISQGLDAYRAGTQADQAIAMNERKIQIADQQIAKAEQIDPLAAEEAKLKLEQKRMEYAEQIKLRDKENQLIDILQGQDNVAKADALLGGGFADVFSAKPKLHEQALISAYDSNAINAQQVEFIRNNQQANRYQQGLARDAFKYEKQATDNFNAFNSTQLANTLKNLDPNRDSLDIFTDSIEYYPAGETLVDPNKGIMNYDSAGLRAISPTYEVGSAVRGYDIFDKSTGRLIARNIPSDQIQAAIAAAKSRREAPIGSSSGRGLVEAAAESILRALGFGGSEPNQQTPPPKPVMPQGYNPKIEDSINSPVSVPKQELPQTLSLTDFRSVLGQQRELAGINGKIDIRTVPNVDTILTRSLGVTPSAVEPYKDALTDLVQDYVSAGDAISPSLFGNNNFSLIRDIGEKTDLVLEDILDSAYPSMVQGLSAEEKHNMLSGHYRTGGRTRFGTIKRGESSSAYTDYLREERAAGRTPVAATTDFSQFEDELRQRFIEKQKPILRQRLQELARQFNNQQKLIDQAKIRSKNVVSDIAKSLG